MICPGPEGAAQPEAPSQRVVPAASNPIRAKRPGSPRRRFTHLPASAAGGAGARRSPSRRGLATGGTRPAPPRPGAPAAGPEREPGRRRGGAFGVAEEEKPGGRGPGGSGEGAGRRGKGRVPGGAGRGEGAGGALAAPLPGCEPRGAPGRPGGERAGPEGGTGTGTQVPDGPARVPRPQGWPVPRALCGLGPRPPRCPRTPGLVSFRVPASPGSPGLSPPSGARRCHRGTGKGAPLPTPPAWDPSRLQWDGQIVNF